MKIIILFLISIGFSGVASSHDARPDDHAPIGVMGDHTHNRGEWMLSYRWMRMEMEESLDGTQKIDTASVLAQFPVAPLKMTMDMHMFGAMYGLSDAVTLMLMVPYLEISMDHINRNDATFTTETSGIGDVSLTALIDVWEKGPSKVHVNAGLSLPTGSIDEKVEVLGNEIKGPYPMQLGSGTIDLKPAITYYTQRGDWTYGTQLGGVIRLGRNNQGYARGHRGYWSLWYGRKFVDWMSATLRLQHQKWGNVDGEDGDLNAAQVQTADPNRQGGERTDIGFGINLLGQSGWVHGHRLAVEYSIPVYQFLNGPQLETDSVLTIGYQKSW